MQPNEASPAPESGSAVPTRGGETMSGGQAPAVEDQRRFWNKWNLEARCPQRLNQWTVLRGEAILRLLSSLGLQRPNIIDLGCGTGWLTERLAAYGMVTGVDLSDEAIAHARSRAPHINYIAGNVFDIPWPEGHFDVVVSQDVVAHVVDQPAYIAIAAGLLKPAGYLIITTTNRFVVERMSLPPQPPEHIERWLTMRSFRRLLSSHFLVERTTTVMPVGSKGVLRIVNSPRLESFLKPVVSPEALAAVKERLGLGYNLLALARKRPHAAQSAGRSVPTQAGS
jgi:2-polyprenyl-3-methyl-5-hydroxy-6-metoxy-1,4-benzoquinol methylase